MGAEGATFRFGVKSRKLGAPKAPLGRKRERKGGGREGREGRGRRREGEREEMKGEGREGRGKEGDEKMFLRCHTEGSRTSLPQDGSRA